MSLKANGAATITKFKEINLIELKFIHKEHQKNSRYQLHLLFNFPLLLVLSLGPPPGLDVLLPILSDGVLALGVHMSLGIIALDSVFDVFIFSLMAYFCNSTTF